MILTSFILDSGAFSAWTRGVEIDIDDYIKFVFDNIDYIDVVVNLDVIPGSFGVVPTAAEVEVSAQRSWDNMLYMESFGIKPMPVFHQGERFAWLQRMIDHGHDYIGISPANDRSTREKILWLDDVFSRITDEDGRATIRTHAFGATSTETLFRYPWFTADSTTWIMAGNYGTVMVPSVNPDGSWRFSRRIPRVVVSQESDPTRSQHYETLTDSERETVLRFIAEAGSSLEGVRASHTERNRVNAYFYKLLSDANLDIRFKRKQRPFFDLS